LTTNNEKPPKVLYHYTTIQGLIGILQNKNIWATSIFHLNDKEELFHARKLFIEAISKYKDEILNEESLLVNDVLQLLKNFSEDFPIFVISFSAVKNQLSQWRGYCPGGNGFMIGFDSFKLQKKLGHNGIRLVQCKYEDVEQKSFVDNFIRERIILRKSNSEEEDFDSVKIVLQIIEMLPILKNKSFREEKEWRLIIDLAYKDLSKIKFRIGKTVPIPYIEVDLIDKEGKLPIESIMVGPTPNKDESIKSINLFKYKEKMTNLKVEYSDIPYREI
jgi:hypothetical protein